jgi:ABC-2 type transport system ATP-binding protein
VLHEGTDDDRYVIKISPKSGNTANEILQYLIPKASIHLLQEVIPSMNEIFIEQVNKKSA